MPSKLCTVVMVALMPLVAGCQISQVDLDAMKMDWDRSQQRRSGEPYVPPGLESIYGQPNPAPLEPVTVQPVPQPPARGVLPFQPGRVGDEQAERLLAGDPMALRFLAFKHLCGQGLVPVAECSRRTETNVGALLPLTAAEPPAMGLDRPIAPLDQVTARFKKLFTGPPEGEAARSAERGFLMEQLLPAFPERREKLSPPDIQSARKLQQRLGRLEDAGLVTADERAAENDAVEKLIAGGTLPEMLEPPKPPEPPKPAKKPGSGKSSRLAGGVKGVFEVIPSPPGAEPARLAAGAKGPAGMHLLSMGTAAHGDKAWDALQKENAELSGLGHVVSRADLGDLGVTYRLIAGPVDAAEAERLCAVLKARGQTCTPTPFPAAGK